MLSNTSQDRGATMIRKELLPALLALLAGCATGYDYRAGNGDYYYGQPQVDYQDYGDFGYGYPGGWSGMLGYGMGYGGYGYGPYGYGYPYFYPYGYGYPYIPHHRVIVVPDQPPASRPGPRGHHDGYVPAVPGVLPSVRSLSPHDRHLLMADPGARPISERSPMLMSPPAPRLLLDRPEPIRMERSRGRDESDAAPARGRRDRDDGLRPHP
jgi:hypothetical protein